MTKASGTKAYLIVSDDKEPEVALKSGKRFEVRTLEVVDPKLNPSQKIAARLCGETSSCQALIEIE
ncbi:hypothetical protein BRAS3843_940020 [Bradyrhizobium sp. STM 3843]|nr:hypothetical protein BRAS3843_940020 [Bradyrhizobium sp. STM 3843]